METNLIKVNFMISTSHLTRGAWIEITYLTALRELDMSRTSHEVRGLKFRQYFLR